MRVRRPHVLLLLLSSLLGCGQGGSRHHGAFAVAPATSAAASSTSLAGTSAVAATPATIGAVSAPANAPALGPVATAASPPAAPGPVTTPTTGGTTAPTPTPAPAQPATFSPATRTPFKRLVLGLDGVPYRVIADLQARGRFKDFHPASRMISTFPSLSSLAWAQLLDIGPEAGYQSVYYSNQLNKAMPPTLDAAQGSRFKKRMHHWQHGIVAHGIEYLAPFLAGEHYLKKLIKEIGGHKDSVTAFAYAGETDACAHMRGRDKLERMLETLDDELKALARDHQARTGQKLEIALVSDHGHTLQKGEMIELEKHLKANGYKVVDKITNAKEVSFVLAGILSSVAVHTQAGAEDDVARVIAQLKGVDLCALKGAANVYRLVSDRGEAKFTYDPARDAFRYDVVTGADPIDYVPVYRALAIAGKVDTRGFAGARDVFEATRDHLFPSAPARIKQGLTDLVHSPAQVLVSLKKGFESGRGIVKTLASLVGRNGTHGALAQNDSAGVFVTNYTATPPAIAPEDFRRLVDLTDYKANPPALEVSIEPRFDPRGKRIGGELACHVRDDGATASRARGETTKLKVLIERERFLFIPDVKVAAVEADEATLKKDGPVSFVLPVANAPALLQEGKKYEVKVTLERRDANGTVVKKEERSLTFKYNGTYQDAD